MTVGEIEGSFKLNQHKSDVDQCGGRKRAGAASGRCGPTSSERNARAAAATVRKRDGTIGCYGDAGRNDVMSAKKKIGVLGASGYTGADAVRLLARASECRDIRADRQYSCRQGDG
jgi:hypothetical protein